MIEPISFALCSLALGPVMLKTADAYLHKSKVKKEVAEAEKAKHDPILVKHEIIKLESEIYEYPITFCDCEECEDNRQYAQELAEKAIALIERAKEAAEREKQNEISYRRAKLQYHKHYNQMVAESYRKDEVKNIRPLPIKSERVRKG